MYFFGEKCTGEFHKQSTIIATNWLPYTGFGNSLNLSMATDSGGPATERNQNLRSCCVWDHPEHMPSVLHCQIYVIYSILLEENDVTLCRTFCALSDGCIRLDSVRNLNCLGLT